MEMPEGRIHVHFFFFFWLVIFLPYLILKYHSFSPDFKVRWDETSAIPRPDRVSPWKVEPALSPPALNPLPIPRQKRPRSNVLPSSPDSSVLTREGYNLPLYLNSIPWTAFISTFQAECFFCTFGTFLRFIQSSCRHFTSQWVFKSFARSRNIDLERQFCRK